MNAIVPFTFEDQPVRVVEINGEPWFVLADVCRVLGIANARDAAARLDDDERDDVGLTDAIGREQLTTVINEPGVYRLTMRSRRPEAKALAKFIYSVVMPSIRRTGSYSAGPASLPRDPRELLAYIAQQAGDMIGLQDHNAALQPKAAALDRLAAARGAMNVTESAKVLKTTRDELFRYLHSIGWTYRAQASGRWQCHADKERAGLLEQRTTRIPNPHGPDKVGSTVMVTPKWLAKLSEQMATAR